jgi:hypothetical protein
MPSLSQAFTQGFAQVDVVLGVPAARVRALHRAGRQSPSPVTTTALIDTGSHFTYIDPSVRRALNLVPYTTASALTPASPATVACYQFKVDLTIKYPGAAGQLFLLRHLLPVAELAISHLGADVLIGCEFLADCVFVYRGPQGQFTLAY